jgi:predicted NAD/FAD-binding protein
MTSRDSVEVAVLGAGWAGLAASIHLVRAGRRVLLIDAAPQAGGRARRITLNWKHPLHGANPVDLDNGQHLLLGAYTEVLALLDLLGTLDEAHMERRPMRLAGSGGLLMQRPSFGDSRPGAPGIGLVGALLTPLSPLLALVRAQGLSAGARWAMVRALVQLRLSGWMPPAGVRTVTDWYAHARQPAELVERVWQPLAISALNTPADSACAATFIRVLRDCLGGPPGASDFVLPCRDLSDLFVDPALGWLRQHGARLMLRTDVRRIERGVRLRYRLVGSARHADQPAAIECDEVVLATPPYSSARLLEGLADPALVAALNGFQYLPITTAYLGWPQDAVSIPAAQGALREPLSEPPPPRRSSALPAFPALLALRESPARQRHAQWFFDRGPHAQWHVAALVLSDSRVARELGDTKLAAALVSQVVEEIGLPAPLQLSLIHEKRATLACTPDRPRLSATSPGPQLAGLVLAGDYAYGEYPATLEGAVRSGRAAAQALTGAGGDHGDKLVR